MTAKPERLYGVVEGFYGRPWNLAQRRTLFGWLKAGRLNAYLYAPKDDARHRTLWRVLYDEAEATALAQLIRDCQLQGIRFIYAISPGLDIRFADPTEAAALKGKLEQVRGLGVSDFALLFDDIPGELSEPDQKRFGGAAAAQAHLANQVLEWARAWSPEATVLFCPTEYCGRLATPSVAASAYLRGLGERLAPEIRVLWTGPEIISETISVESIGEVKRVIGRDPILWDNLHANDYDMRRLYLGPYAGRPPELQAELGGVLLNPNCQFDANFVAIHTLAAWCREGTRYAPRTAYREALTAWLPYFESRGRQPFTLEDLQLAADIFHLPTEFGELANRYLADLKIILRTPPNAWGEAAARFEQTTRQIVALYDKVIELANRELMYALYVHFWELKENALLLGAWARWRQKNPTAREPFSSAEFRPRIFRGGFVAATERLLEMDEQGRFHPRF